MKKLFAILAVTAFMTSCNDTETKAVENTDSLKAAATADSMAAIKALADTAKKTVDTAVAKIDTAMKAMPKAKDTAKAKK